VRLRGPEVTNDCWLRVYENGDTKLLASSSAEWIDEAGSVFAGTRRQRRTTTEPTAIAHVVTVRIYISRRPLHGPSVDFKEVMWGCPFALWDEVSGAVGKYKGEPFKIVHHTICPEARTR
jgi:hypothetical protein